METAGKGRNPNADIIQTRAGSNPGIGAYRGYILPVFDWYPEMDGRAWEGGHLLRVFDAVVTLGLAERRASEPSVSHLCILKEVPQY
jgi:hypothetical protein